MRSLSLIPLLLLCVAHAFADAPAPVNNPKDPIAIKARQQAWQDSIAATEADIAAVKASVEAQLPALNPKDEFETSDAFKARKALWEKDRDAKAAAGVAPRQAHLQQLRAALDAENKNAAELQGTLEVSSVPAGAKVSVDGKEVGKTPLKVSNLWEGSVKLSIQQEGFLDYVATPQVKGGKTTELEALLQERSIFSQMTELNLSALLAKDTPTVATYQARITRINDRIAEVDREFAAMVTAVTEQTPLQPKGEFETQAAFETRKEAWSKQTQQNTADLQAKYQTYRGRLTRAIEVLADYALGQTGEPKSVAIPNTEMTLGTYNADQATYPFTVTHAADGFQFSWEGAMKLSLEEAKALNKQTTAFDLQARYYDLPVAIDGTVAFPAWHSLQLSKQGKPVPADGTFKLPAAWLADARVLAAVAKADSLRKGLVAPKGLDPSYALDFKASSPSHGSGRTWLYVARGVLFLASAVGVYEGYRFNKQGGDLTSAYNPVNIAQARVQLDKIHATDKSRNNAYMIGGLCGLAGVITLAF